MKRSEMYAKVHAAAEALRDKLADEEPVRSSMACAMQGLEEVEDALAPRNRRNVYLKLSDVLEDGTPRNIGWDGPVGPSKVEERVAHYTRLGITATPQPATPNVERVVKAWQKETR